MSVALRLSCINVPNAFDESDSSGTSISSSTIFCVALILSSKMSNYALCGMRTHEGIKVDDLPLTENNEDV